MAVVGETNLALLIKTPVGKIWAVAVAVAVAEVVAEMVAWVVRYSSGWDVLRPGGLQAEGCMNFSFGRDGGVGCRILLWLGCA